MAEAPRLTILVGITGFSSATTFSFTPNPKTGAKPTTKNKKVKNYSSEIIMTLSIVLNKKPGEVLNELLLLEKENLGFFITNPYLMLSCYKKLLSFS